MSDRPPVLVTNDDGIESYFLERLVTALLAHFQVTVVAPLREQSWIGRAMSRHRAVALNRTEIAGQPAWAVDGTPSDCVNLALGHLLPERPLLVVSGINIGYNTSVPLLYSSGTIAGALEGAHWDLPAIAVSQAVLPEHYAEVVSSKGHVLPPSVECALDAAAEHASRFAARLTETANPDLVVHNLNYPADANPQTELRRTVPARVQLGSLFARGAEESFAFQYPVIEHTPGDRLSDREAVSAGFASWTRLDFSCIGG